VVGFVIPGFSIAWQYSGIGRITPFRLNEFAGIGRICLPGGPFGGYLGEVVMGSADTACRLVTQSISNKGV